MPLAGYMVVTQIVIEGRFTKIEMDERTCNISDRSYSPHNDRIGLPTII